MVTEQLESRGINDPRVLTLMREIPRHEFVPAEYLNNAYADYPLAIGEGQTISQPFMVALMTQTLELSGKERVLEIGTGCGYQTAILSVLSKEVYSIERIRILAERARLKLDKLGFTNIKINIADGTSGWEEYSPYDRVIVTAAAPQVPPALEAQLAEGGIMVIPLGGSLGQMLIRIKKENGRLKSEDICACVFVPLVGEFGWRQNGS